MEWPMVVFYVLMTAILIKPLLFLVIVIPIGVIAIFAWIIERICTTVLKYLR